MKHLHVACGQFSANHQHPNKNIDVMEAQSTEAGRRECDLILFPEMCLTGFMSPAELLPLAEPATGSSVRRIAEVAAQTGIAIGFGFPEYDPESAAYFNTFLFIDKEGQTIGKYRKIHLWRNETAWAKPGEEITLFNVDGTSLSAWICYDTRFPELARLAMLRGAEVCLVPSAWTGPFEEWDLSLRARALDNSMFVLGSDLINQHPELRCWGLSIIVGPRGEVLARATPEKDCVIDAVLDPGILEEQREKVPLFEDRSPQVYAPLFEGKLTSPK